MTGIAPLPREALQRITREFAGERILWAGQPSARRAFLKSLPIFLFAIPWTAFALTWEGIALAALFADGPAKPTGAGGWLALVFPIFGLPFVLIGFVMLAAPFYVAHRSRYTVHVLTEERLIEARLRQTVEIKSYPIVRITSFTRCAQPDGSGDMTFALGITSDSDGLPTDRTEIWYGVPDVAGLEAALRGVLRGAGA